MPDHISDAKEIIEDFVSEYDELAKLFPYAKQVVAAYKFVREKRMKRFLNTLSNAQEQLTSGERKYFGKLLESEDGQELLAEYADSVINTSSKTANIALALLYADVKTESFDESFKTLAALALRGISESAISLFIILIMNKDLMRMDSDPPYPLWTFSEKFIAEVFDVNSEFRNAPFLYSSVSDLIRRGLFAPDHVLGAFVEPRIIISFGITEITMSFYDLLSRAKEIAKQLG
jgi:hypothetical protein